MPTDLGVAIDIMHRALAFDTKKNYAEALKLYEVGIEHFLDALHNEVQGETAQEAIVKKCRSYCERAEEIRQTINKVKLSEMGEDTNENKVQETTNHLPKAIEQLTRALQEDKKSNRLDALRLYEKGLFHFDIVINSEILSEKFKEALQSRRKVYEERVKILQEQIYQ